MEKQENNEASKKGKREKIKDTKRQSSTVSGEVRG